MSIQITNALIEILELSSLPTIDLIKTILSGLSLSEKQSIDKKADKDVNNEVLFNNLERQAKLIRDLAISRRIDTAEKVSIEEFYDSKGDGKVGMQKVETELNIGLSGSGERVTKRIYTFEGWRDGGLKGVDEEILRLLKESVRDNRKEKSTIEE